MRLLLDTQVFIWATMDSPRLSERARAIVRDAAQVHVSAASIWEIAIKARLGKIDADPLMMADAIDESGFLELPVTTRHAAGVGGLPLHHHDPFDRLLVAQAIAEPLHLLSADPVVARYTDLVISV